MAMNPNASLPHCRVRAELAEDPAPRPPVSCRGSAYAAFCSAVQAIPVVDPPAKHALISLFPVTNITSPFFVFAAATEKTLPIIVVWGLVVERSSSGFDDRRQILHFWVMDARPSLRTLFTNYIEPHEKCLSRPPPSQSLCMTR